MLSQRRSLLQYLRKNRFEAYSVLIARLGLKDSFAKQVGFQDHRTPLAQLDELGQKSSSQCFFHLLTQT